MEESIDFASLTSSKLILDGMMKKFKYFPNNSEFESISKEIPDKINFSIIFNHFLLKLKDFDKTFTDNLSSKKIKDNYLYSFILDDYFMKYLESNDKEVINYVGKFWTEHYNSNIIHTCLFLILVDKYIKIHGKISDYDTNILYWTILFHDLGKYQEMNPFIKENIDSFNYDKTHPFKSLIIFLDNAFIHDLFDYSNNEYKTELINIYKDEFKNAIFKSWKLEDNKKPQLYNISFKYIDIIEKFFMKIKSETKNEWIYDICVLIAFHQSLPNNEYHMNYPLLEEKYIKIFFSKRLFELMRIIMIYDSSSHSLFFDSIWIGEINKNMDTLIKLFQ